MVLQQDLLSRHPVPADTRQGQSLKDKQFSPAPTAMPASRESFLRLTRPLALRSGALPLNRQPAQNAGESRECSEWGTFLIYFRSVSQVLRQHIFQRHTPDTELEHETGRHESRCDAKQTSAIK
ncbi:hypothetical protein TRVL_09652 [Trypanosoma vivax]|nr:hypothetical protein TRVL_09652 [Trypanosoma vivax]